MTSDPVFLFLLGSDDETEVSVFLRFFSMDWSSAPISGGFCLLSAALSPRERTNGLSAITVEEIAFGVTDDEP
jgi:hypothetical protein